MRVQDEETCSVKGETEIGAVLIDGVEIEVN